MLTAPCVKKKFFILIGAFILGVLTWAPWMSVSSLAKQRAIYTHEVLVGTCQDVRVSWVPFGRYLSNCEGGRFVFLWW